MLNQTSLDHTWIARHIPHQGNMCLLDHVEAWDQHHIQCCAISHRSPDNPLRANSSRLGAACGIEYAAQAMAVHGALLVPETTRPRVGYLVSVRSTKLYVSRLDDIAADLQVEATCINRGENNLLYQFSVSASGDLLLEGRAAVVVDADAVTPFSGNMP